MAGPVDDRPVGRGFDRRASMTRSTHSMPARTAQVHRPVARCRTAAAPRVAPTTARLRCAVMTRPDRTAQPRLRAAAPSGRRRCPPCRIDPDGRCPTRPTSWCRRRLCRASTPPASWRRAAPAVTLLEARALWVGRARPGTAASSTPATSGAPRELIKRYGEETGRALYQETLDVVRARQAPDRRRGDRLRLPRGRPSRARLRAIARRRARARRATSLASVGVDADARAARAASARRSGRTRTTAALAVEGSGLLHPGEYFAGLAAAADRAGADLHEGVRATRDPPPGATGGSSSRPTAARSSPGTCSSPRTATRTGSCRRSGGGSSRSGATSSRASHSPRTWHASCRRRAARSSTRRTSSTTGTCRRTAG